METTINELETGAKALSDDRSAVSLVQGEKVKVSGFGNFVVRHKNARKGRNPQTGQEILLDARKVLTFKPSLVLKNVLNDEDEVDEGNPQSIETVGEPSDIY